MTMESAIKQRIIDKGVTTEQVAKMVGIDKATLSRIVNGKQIGAKSTIERIDLYLSKLNTDDENIFNKCQ